MTESAFTSARAPRARAIALALLRARWRIAWCFVFALYLGARLYHLEQAPAHAETSDEYAWTWSGMTLLQEGKPRAWSNLKAYARRRNTLFWRDHRYHIVEPWLDHPPLYSLYAGAWQLAWGRRDIFDVDLREMRLGSVPLAGLSFCLLTALLRRLLPPAEVLLSLLFYAVMPAIVLQQRLVVSENMFVPLCFGLLLLLHRQAPASQRSWGRAALLLMGSALLPLIKVAALSCSVLLVLTALAGTSARARWLDAGAVVLGTGLGVGGYLWFGHHQDAALFRSVLASHHDRFRGFSGMETLLFEPQVINVAWKDLLAVLGCALALGSLSHAQPTTWGLGVLVYTACMAFFVDERRIYGWYFLPLYPWFCTALGTTIVRASRLRLVGLSLLWCSVAWLNIARVLFSKQLLPVNPIRNGYLLGFLALAGAWFAWPRLARLTIPGVNAAFVAATALACLYEVYLR